MNAIQTLRIRPTEHEWEQYPDPHGRPTTPVRILRSDDPYVLEADFPPHFHAGLHWHPYDTIYLITAGSMRFGDEGTFRDGDIRWVRGGHAYGPERAGPNGVQFHLISLGGAVGLNWADLYEVPDAVRTRLAGFGTRAGRLRLGHADLLPWPVARPAAGVRAERVSDEHPHVLRFVLEPHATLPEFAFATDTLTCLRRGTLRATGDEAYETGDLRWVRAGAPAGALTAGPQGADLVAIGLGGPLGV